MQRYCKTDSGSQINPFAPTSAVAPAARLSGRWSGVRREVDVYRVGLAVQAVDRRAMEARTAASRRTERIVFETDRHLVVGDITLPPEGYQSRFSDAVNRADVAFIPILNVEITPLGQGEGTTVRRDFVVLAKSSIQLAYPLDGLSG
jgi:hypothetical protein